MNFSNRSLRQSGFDKAGRDRAAFSVLGASSSAGVRPALNGPSRSRKVQGSSPDQRRKALGAFSVTILSLLIWGPPRLRLESRSSAAALSSPTDQDAAALFQIAVVLMAAALAFSIFVVLKKNGLTKIRYLLKGPLVWYALFSLSAVLSVVYSVSKVYTAYFALKLFAAWALPVLIIAYYGESALSVAMSCVRWVFFSQMLAILLFGIIKPDLAGIDIPGVGYRLTGGTLEDYGLSGAISLIFVLGSLCSPLSKGRRSLLVVMLLPCLIYLYASRSRSVLAAAVIVVAITLLISLGRKFMAVAGVLVVVGAVLVVAALIAFSPDKLMQATTEYVTRGQSEKELLTGSGRTKAFSFLVDVWKEDPYLGDGYGAGTRAALQAFEAKTHLNIGSGHDVLSRTLVDLGIVGAILIAVLYISSIILVRRAVLMRKLKLSAELRLNLAVAAALVVMALMKGDASAGVSDPEPFFSIALAVLTLSTFRNRRIFSGGARFRPRKTSGESAHVLPTPPQLVGSSVDWA